MKNFNIKLTTLIALAAIIGYTSCQKSATKPAATTTVDYNAIAKSIGTSLNASMTGQLGGVNINDGVKAPSSVGMTKGEGKVLNSSVSSLCGYTIDTTYSSYTTPGDSTKWLSGKFTFKYTCNFGILDGYNAYDSLRTEVQTPTTLAEYTNAQNYVTKTLKADFSEIILNGTITTLTYNTIKATPTLATEYHDLACYYKLKGVVVKFVSGTSDIVAGYATFVSKTTDITKATGAEGFKMNYTGSMTWIGHHQAKLTIDPNHKYLMDFTTTPATITPTN